MASAAETFDPIAYSLEEAQFLIDHVGDAPEVVEIDTAGRYPVGVNPNAVMPAIERIFRLCQQAEHRGLQWAGVDAVKDACKTYIHEFARWAQDRKQGAPKYPSQYEWDEQGRATKHAVNADGNTVKSYFDDNGIRHDFAITLVGKGASSYKPSWVAKNATKAPIPKLLDDAEKGTLQCPICFFTQTYDPNVRSTFNVAKGRMAKHLLHSRQKPDAHREVYTQEFPRGDINKA